MNKYFAETLGTFTLTLVVALSLAGTFPVPTPVLAALTLGLFVYSVGHISGTHLNPAVTIGLWSLRKIKERDALLYVVSQFVGAIMAMLVVQMTVGLPDLTVVANSRVILAELLGTFFFTFGIASAVFNKTYSQLSGIIIGGSLLLGISVAALLGSNGVLNPAVALGIGSFNLVYAIAPVLGSLLGMQVYKRLTE